MTYSHYTKNRLTADTGARTASLLYDLFGCRVRIDDGNFNIAGVRAIVNIVLKSVKNDLGNALFEQFLGDGLSPGIGQIDPKRCKK